MIGIEGDDSEFVASNIDNGSVVAGADMPEAREWPGHWFAAYCRVFEVEDVVELCHDAALYLPVQLAECLLESFGLDECVACHAASNARLCGGSFSTALGT